MVSLFSEKHFSRDHDITFWRFSLSHYEKIVWGRAHSRQVSKSECGAKWYGLSIYSILPYRQNVSLCWKISKASRRRDLKWKKLLCRTKLRIWKLKFQSIGLDPRISKVLSANIWSCSSFMFCIAFLVSCFLCLTVPSDEWQKKSLNWGMNWRQRMWESQPYWKKTKNWKRRFPSISPFPRTSKVLSQNHSIYIIHFCLVLLVLCFVVSSIDPHFLIFGRRDSSIEYWGEGTDWERDCNIKWKRGIEK